MATKLAIEISEKLLRAGATGAQSVVLLPGAPPIDFVKWVDLKLEPFFLALIHSRSYVESCMDEETDPAGKALAEIDFLLRDFAS